MNKDPVSETLYARLDQIVERARSEDYKAAFAELLREFAVSNVELAQRAGGAAQALEESAMVSERSARQAERSSRYVLFLTIVLAFSEVVQAYCSFRERTSALDTQKDREASPIAPAK